MHEAASHLDGSSNAGLTPNTPQKIYERIPFSRHSALERYNATREEWQGAYREVNRPKLSYSSGIEVIVLL